MHHPRHQVLSQEQLHSACNPRNCTVHTLLTFAEQGNPKEWQGVCPHLKHSPDKARRKAVIKEKGRNYKQRKYAPLQQRPINVVGAGMSTVPEIQGGNYVARNYKTGTEQHHFVAFCGNDSVEQIA